MQPSSDRPGRSPARIRPLARELARLDVRERVLPASDRARRGQPDRVARLRARLVDVRERKVEVRRHGCAPLTAEARRLADQARRLRAEAARLQQQAAALQRQADELERQKSSLQQQAAELQREGDQLQQQAASLRRQGNELQQQAAELQQQADDLKAEQQQAQQEQTQAEQLKQQLTDMVTQAGGDPRGTDPRVVDLQDGLSATSGVVALTPPQLNKKGDVVLLSAVPETAPASDDTADLVAHVRDTVLPGHQRGRRHHVVRRRLHGVVRRPRLADLRAAAPGDRDGHPARASCC